MQTVSIVVDGPIFTTNYYFWFDLFFQVNNLKKTVKTHPTQQEMADESMSIESREALGIDKTPTKKAGAKKSTRGKAPK